MSSNQIHFSIAPIGRGDERVIKAYVGDDKVMEVRAQNEQEAQLIAKSWKRQTQKVLRQTSTELNKTAKGMKITERRRREEKML